MISQFLLYNNVSQLYVCVCTCICGRAPLFWVSFPLRSSQSPEQRPLCCTAGSHSLSVLNTAVYTCQFQSPHLPSPWHPCTCFLGLWLCFNSEIKFISTIFLDSTYKQYYTIFVFVFQTYFTQCDNFQVQPHLCEGHSFIPFLQLSNIPLYICASSFSIPLLDI